MGKLAALGVAVWVTASTGARAQEVRRFGGEAPRMCTRIAYFGINTSEGQLAIDYGQPEWKAEYEAQFDELTKGKRWRFGTNFWTTLDTHLDLTIAGVQVPFGYYYLVLERSEADDWYLVLLDPQKVQAKKLDASQAERTTGGIKAPLAWERIDETEEKLTIRLSPVDGELQKATVTIRWGRHSLSAPIDVSL